uniref:Uncharacterized protein n=1 Tax=Strongyloides papillosus TaxID=174720 RepID=A0A0N5CEK8_STREA
MRKLKINYFFDIIHPQSYIGYQLLKKSIPILSNNFNTALELFPVSCFGVWKSNNITSFQNLPENQRNLLNNEIENICRSYSLDLHNMNVNRQFAEPLNKNCLLYLTMVKREHSNLYLKFIETFFLGKMLSDVECKNLPIISFQFIEDSEKEMLIDSIAKFVVLYDVIKKDPYSLEKVIERYCNI